MRSSLIVVLLCACPPSTTLDAGSSPDADVVIDAGALDAGAITPEQFCTLFGTSVCAQEERCGQAALSFADACRRTMTRQCEGAVGARLRAHAVSLNASAAQRCLSLLASGPCQSLDLYAALQPCAWEALVVANAGVGEKCATQEDCVHGRCGRNSADECPTCLAGAALGAACPRGFECDPTTAFCKQGQCVAKLADAQPCTADAQCMSAHCALSSGAPTCGRSAAGAACSTVFGNDCAAGLFCNAGTCVARLTAALGSLAAGAPCDDALQCQAGLFCSGLTQATRGTCQPWLAPDAACDAQGGCAANARCRNGHCGALSSAGEPCAQRSDCKLGLWCPQGANATCTAARTVGQPCERDTVCVDSYCDAYFTNTPTPTCRPYISVGQQCTAARDVVANFICESQVCAGARDGGDSTQCYDCLSGP